MAVVSAIESVPPSSPSETFYQIGIGQSVYFYGVLFEIH